MEKEEEVVEDICSICYENFNKQSYTLECNHKFHTECIMKWFRNDNSSCPLCNDSIQYKNLGYWERLYTIGQIKNLGRRKDCPIKIRKILDKIKKVKEKAKLCKINIKEFKNKHNIHIRRWLYLRRNKYKFMRQIRMIERQLLTFITINPIYIHKEKKK